MTQQVMLPGGTKGVLANPQHLLLLAMANGGGYIARGAGASRPQLVALAKARPALATLQVEREGLRDIVTGATLTSPGWERLVSLNAALARKQHIDHIAARGFGDRE